MTTEFVVDAFVKQRIRTKNADGRDAYSRTDKEREGTKKGTPKGTGYVGVRWGVSFERMAQDLDATGRQCACSNIC